MLFWLTLAAAAGFCVYWYNTEIPIIKYIYIFFFLSKTIRYLSTSPPTDFPPGPRLPLPFLGSALDVGSNNTEGFERLRSEYGDAFGVFVGPVRSAVLCSWELIK